VSARRRRLGELYDPFFGGDLMVAGDGSGWIYDEYGDLVPATAQATYADPETMNLVERLRAEAQRFASAYATFQANYADAQALGLGAEAAELEARAQTAQRYIQQVADAVSGAWGWVKSTFGLAGARLGALPALPIAAAVIAGALAWIISVRTDLAKFNARVAAESEGVRIGPGDGDSASGNLSSTIKWGVALAALLLLGPPALQALSRER